VVQLKITKYLLLYSLLVEYRQLNMLNFLNPVISKNTIIYVITYLQSIFYTLQRFWISVFNTQQSSVANIAFFYILITYRYNILRFIIVVLFDLFNYITIKNLNSLPIITHKHERCKKTIKHHKNFSCKTIRYGKYYLY